MKRTYQVVFILLFFVVGLISGCGNAIPTSELPSRTPSYAPLIPYHSVTPSPSTQPTLDHTATPLPSPTLTPLTYSIKKGDDLFGIALRFGISLDELMAANPDVKPNLLSVGTVLIIPNVVRTPSDGEITPTAISILLKSPVCYSSADQGLWCFASVENDQTMPIENISAVFMLVPQGEGPIQEQIASTPLNRLLPGQTQALSTYFSAPLPDRYVIGAQLRTALRIPADDQRYLDVQVALEKTTLDPTGKTAQVEGTFQIQGTQPAQKVIVVAIAVDTQGQVIGIKQFSPGQSTAPGETQAFSFSVYSAGPVIARVDVLAEAYP